jgi:polysaccharide chain length determinant protein (PEP-CTERM system associated)
MPRESDNVSLAEESDAEISEVVGRLFAILIRRRWLMIVSACTIALGTIAVLFYLPNRYTSEASLFAVQQRIPERYVVPTATSDVAQALEAMVQEVLSRPRLLGVINELGLYPNQRKSLEPEQLIHLMRRDVTVVPIESKLGRGEVNAFKVSFVAENPHTAQAVTQRLTTLFIEQNLKTRADQTNTTTNFLHEQLEAAKKELHEQEQRLRDFKMQYLGELPEQQQGNLAILTGLETQISNVMSNRNQAQQQRLYVQSLLNEHRRRELTRLQAERRTLLTTYTPQHPAVLKKDQEISRKQTLVDDFKASKTVSVDIAGDAEEDLSAIQLMNQLRTTALEVENLVSKEQKLRLEIDQYRRRLNIAPVREQQLTSLQRDYDLLRQHYGELLKKDQESQLATNLEKRQEGQQFRLADPPNLPTRPSSPNRVKISLIALLGGLVVGCAFAFLAEARNSSFHTEDDATSLALPIVVGVPLFFTPAEKRGRSRKRSLEWCTGLALLFTVVAAEYFVYLHG